MHDDVKNSSNILQLWPTNHQKLDSKQRDMREGIYESGKCDLTAWIIIHKGPNHDRKNDVMDQQIIGEGTFSFTEDKW